MEALPWLYNTKSINNTKNVNYASYFVVFTRGDRPVL